MLNNQTCASAGFGVASEQDSFRRERITSVARSFVLMFQPEVKGFWGFASLNIYNFKGRKEIGYQPRFDSKLNDDTVSGCLLPRRNKSMDLHHNQVNRILINKHVRHFFGGSRTFLSFAFCPHPSSLYICYIDWSFQLSTRAYKWPRNGPNITNKKNI